MNIYRIHFSENDSLEIVGRETPKTLVEDVDFTTLVVDKPWGHEYLMYRNPFAQVWSLFIKNNEITSMHCHPNKKTALVLLGGEAVFSTLNTSIRLKAFDSVIIEEGVFHSTRTVMAQGARMLEIETPPLKYDLIRLKDEYGRAGTFYEGKDKMRVDRNGYLRFSQLANSGFVEKEFFGSELCLRKIRGGYEDDDAKILSQYELVVILEGTIRSRKGQVLHSVADIVSQSDYVNNLNSHVVCDLTLLLVKNSPNRE